MENKCNKTPNTNNNNNKYMDHVYCHPVESKNYIRASNNNHSNSSGNGGSGAASPTNAEYLALLKENKQLRAMLILHLDLIQAQSDQLQLKDKQFAAQNEELEGLRVKNQQLDAQVLELQKQLQRHIKRIANSPPPLAKIQRQTAEPLLNSTVSIPATAGAAVLNVPTETAIQSSTSAATTKPTEHIIGECNGKLISKIILSRVSLPEHSPTNSTTTATSTSESTSEADDSTASNSKTQHENENDDDDDDDAEEVAEEDEPGGEDEEEEEDYGDADMEEVGGESTTGHTTEDSNDIVAAPYTNISPAHQRMLPTSSSSSGMLISRGAKPLRQVANSGGYIASTVTTLTSPQIAHQAVAAHPSTSALGHAVPQMPTSTAIAATTTVVCVTPPTPSRGKQMPLMRWHAPEMHSDESASCESTCELSDQRSPMVSSPVSPKVGHKSKKPKNASTTTLSLRSRTQQRQYKYRRGAYISTPQMYCTRAWEDEEVIADGYEFMKEEAQALKADAPMLEIPKWTEHELTVSYCIEGTENLADETFLKRHEKLELAEKRRKKWDVQQIREQRRIEKLKRRHCKDEIQVQADQQPLLSFYPQPDTVQTIFFTSDLPVQAFGELVPKLGPHSAFDLPWLESLNNTRSTAPSSVQTLAQSQCGSSTSLAQSQQQLMNSSFVFVKKRKRQQSSSGAGMTARQRNALRKAAAAATTATGATNASESTVVMPPIATATQQSTVTDAESTTATTTKNASLSNVPAVGSNNGTATELDATPTTIAN